MRWWLKDSSTCPESEKRRAVWRWLAAVLVAAGLSPAARALDPHRLPEQYIRDRWTKEQGYPGGAVNAIAQTRDGYLWIGGVEGLVRFDGLSFVLFNHATTEELPVSPVVSLATDPEGGLWIYMQSMTVIRYYGGVFEVMSAANGVTAMGQGKNESVLLVRTWDPLRYVDHRFNHLPMDREFSQRLVISIAETDDARVWMGTRDYGLFSVRDGKGDAPHGLPDRKVNCLLPVGRDLVWVGTDRGLAKWNGGAVDQAGVPPDLRNAQVLTMKRDRDANLWVGTGRGLMRLTAQATFSVDQTHPRSEAVSALLEDREGNLWVGGPEGIERFRDNTFLIYPAATGNSESSGPIYIDRSDRTWYAPSTGGLFWLKGADRHEVAIAGLDRDVIYSIAGGDQELWVGRQHGGLTRLREREGGWDPETYVSAGGLATGSVYAVHRSRDGSVWAGTLGGGVSHLSGGRITTYTTANGLPSNSVSTIEEGGDGTMWFATPSGLTSLEHDRWRVYTSRDGLPPGRINCLLAGRADTIWIGTEVGLAFLRKGRIQMPRNAPEPLLDEILGVAADNRGDLWIATPKHVVRASGAALFDDSAKEIAVREFGPADGIKLPGGVRRERSAAKDSVGRIWFSLRPGIAVVDPARLGNDTVPAIVHVESMTVDGRLLPGGQSIHIPTASQRVRFAFLALSLSVPERVQYRYRLDGLEHDWSEPVSARDTSYTNLGPGNYRFRVIASNSQGIWNSSEATIGFEVVPAVWQTLWFQALIVGVSVLSAVAIYQLRLRRLTEKLRIRFDERLAERTRIAQELHDTLLQGLLATSMQLHVAVEQLPAESPQRPIFAKVSSMMRTVVTESRNAVRGLRTSTPEVDNLADVFSQVRNEYAPAEGMEFRIVVEGPPCPLNPLARDEVYRIGREALSNAFHHSGAGRVEMEIRYSARDLRLAVRDNGQGIDHAVLNSGREGHWGLVGMRERAERIGAKFRIWSGDHTGTEIELIVPGHAAFAAAAPIGRWWKIWRWGVREKREGSSE